MSRYIFLFLTTFTFYSAFGVVPKKEFSCSQLFIGMLNQKDPALYQAGLFSQKNPDISKICGPVCLINLLTHVRHVHGLDSIDPVFETEFLLKSFPASLDISLPKLREEGMLAYELEKLARWYFAYLELSVEVLTKGVELSKESLKKEGIHLRTSIFPEDLAVSSEKLVILNYEAWNKNDLNLIEPGIVTEESGWAFGHFVVLTDFKRLSSQSGLFEAEFSDPLYGKVTAQLQEVEPKQFGTRTFEIVSLSAPKDPKYKKIIVTNIIKLNLLN